MPECCDPRTDLKIGSPYPAPRAERGQPLQDWCTTRVSPAMRDIVFRVIHEQPGHLVAQADAPAITITAPSLEELHHEARDALIEHMGPAHVSVRVRIRRDHRGQRPGTTAQAHRITKPLCSELHGVRTRPSAISWRLPHSDPAQNGAP